MIPESEIIIRILIAAAMGALVGFERERHNQPAGLRTHIVLVVGAALAMTLSIDLAVRYAPLITGDPARLAAQVVSGIGFLGAGAILRYGVNIRGLTTAASLWTMAVVGLAVGAGMYLVSIAATLLLLVILWLVDIIEKRLFGPDMAVNLTLHLTDRPGIMDEIRDIWQRYKLQARITGVMNNTQDQHLQVDVQLRTRKGALLDILTSALAEVEGLRSYKIGF